MDSFEPVATGADVSDTIHVVHLCDARARHIAADEANVKVVHERGPAFKGEIWRDDADVVRRRRHRAQPRQRRLARGAKCKNGFRGNAAAAVYGRPDEGHARAAPQDGRLDFDVSARGPNEGEHRRSDRRRRRAELVERALEGESRRDASVTRSPLHPRLRDDRRASSGARRHRRHEARERRRHCAAAVRACKRAPGDRHRMAVAEEHSDSSF
mmetsp:Transcript_23180/g.79175  ORF Transcript_23180/g.79175 Transcript_23180/m.79175 type:complete len:213 (-) Transcript_23180:6-644(-)